MPRIIGKELNLGVILLNDEVISKTHGTFDAFRSHCIAFLLRFCHETLRYITNKDKTPTNIG